MSEEPNLSYFAAIVLAGGAGSRLGGARKGSLELDGRSLLDRAVAAVSDAAEVVVVGDAEPTEQAVRFVREEPAYGGPAAGLLAGREALLGGHRAVVVLACDMPRVTTTTVLRLRGAATGRDGAVLLGPDGRRQLAMALDVARLDQVAPPPPARPGLGVWRLLSELTLVEVPAVGDEHRDVDTWADLRGLSS